jgi:NAD(P)-dependent dehydrogenase (short-subunit alcohol dehydrogenase family)
MNPTYNFNDQVALVTGASSGLGFATAKAFAEAGAKVVLSSDNAEKLTAATARYRIDPSTSRENHFPKRTSDGGRTVDPV